MEPRLCVAAGRFALDMWDGKGLMVMDMFSPREGGGAESCRLSAQTRVSWVIPGAQSRAHCALGADSWEPGVQECSGRGAGRAPPTPDGLPGFHLYPQGSLLLRAGSPSAQRVML